MRLPLTREVAETLTRVASEPLVPRRTKRPRPRRRLPGTPAVRRDPAARPRPTLATPVARTRPW